MRTNRNRVWLAAFSALVLTALVVPAAIAAPPAAYSLRQFVAESGGSNGTQFADVVVSFGTEDGIAFRSLFGNTSNGEQEITCDDSSSGVVGTGLDFETDTFTVDFAPDLSRITASGTAMARDYTYNTCTGSYAQGAPYPISVSFNCSATSKLIATSDTEVFRQPDGSKVTFQLITRSRDILGTVQVGDIVVATEFGGAVVQFANILSITPPTG